jgi:hypothetical protein
MALEPEAFIWPTILPLPPPKGEFTEGSMGKEHGPASRGKPKRTQVDMSISSPLNSKIVRLFTQVSARERTTAESPWISLLIGHIAGGYCTFQENQPDVERAKQFADLEKDFRTSASMREYARKGVHKAFCEVITVSWHGAQGRDGLGWIDLAGSVARGWRVDYTRTKRITRAMCHCVSSA